VVYRFEVNIFNLFLFKTYFYLDWTIIRRVFIRARQQFCLQAKDIDISKPDMQIIEVKKKRSYDKHRLIFLFILNSQLYLILMIYVQQMLQNDVLNVKDHIIFVNVVQN